MSAQLLTGPNNNTGAAQGTTAGGTKPLHRFLMGQPKTTGTAVLILGVCFIILAIAVTSNHNRHIWIILPPGIVMGLMFTMCGILFILTEHNTTKKTVTISLALSIISILGASWTLLHSLDDLHFYYHYGLYQDYNETESERTWSSYNQMMGLTTEMVFVVHIFIGAIILIVMSALAGAALRSTKTQTIVMMTSTATEAPVE